jgi:glycosyltransferase involved in cell wall biosynthesis
VIAAPIASSLPAFVTFVILCVLVVMLESMRIALIVTGGVDASGRERVVPALLWLIERLARRHDVHVFALHYYPEARSYPLLGATIHDVGRVDGPPGLRRLRVRARLRRAIGRVGLFDLVHAYWGMPAVVATRVGRRLGVPVVITLDSGELVSLGDIGYGLQRRLIERRAVARAIREATRITVATDYMAQMPPLEGAQVDVVPIGVDTRLFAPAPAVDGPPWRLLRVASINRVKDYAMLLRALASVVTRVRDVHLDIVGSDTLSGSIQALGRELGVDAHVTFHGFQPTDALAAFYARAHLHVLSSRHEAANVATLEAACAGVPTVGTAVGYVADWAPHDRAVAVAVGDHQALACAILDLLRDGARRYRIAAAARAWTLEHDADWTAARFEEIYGDVSRAARGTARGTA